MSWTAEAIGFSQCHTTGCRGCCNKRLILTTVAVVLCSEYSPRSCCRNDTLPRRTCTGPSRIPSPPAGGRTMLGRWSTSTRRCWLRHGRVYCSRISWPPGRRPVRVRAATQRTRRGPDLFGARTDFQRTRSDESFLASLLLSLLPCRRASIRSSALAWHCSSA